MHSSLKPRVVQSKQSEYTMQESGFDRGAGSFIYCSNLDEQMHTIVHTSKSSKLANKND